MVVYRCGCKMCLVNSNKYNQKYIYWKLLKINKNDLHNITWKNSSWFCKRGYNEKNENIYMKYIWGSAYIKIPYHNDIFAIDIPYIYFLFFKILLMLNCWGV